VDTTKHYYDDDEAPEYQIQILNGEEKKVPWAEVPEAQRYILEHEDGLFGERVTVRVPIAKVTTTSLDEEGKPAPPEKAYRYEYTEEGLNPKYKVRGKGGPGR
jgi:hypothetical protein